MRLVQVKADGSFSLARYEGKVPPYAILSHTWGDDGDEITYEDMQNKKEREKEGYAKLAFCATQVAKHGLEHFWIDTCCIDKSSSAELSEAITSMFRWYMNSDRCYVYLTDVTINKRKADQETTHPTWMSAFRTSRWFTRGWTLQELLAPHTLSFFSREGKELGSKLDLAQQIHEITRIPVSALQGAPLHEFSVQERMSWAGKRETKREEDQAYSLLGIFGVSMVANYGEEKEAAFRRLRREIREITANDTTSLDEEEKQLFMSTLRFDQIDARHTTIKNAHAKTCKWILNKSKYVDWLNPTKLSHHHGFLWIKGKPGTGKSTLMKFSFGNAKKTMKRSVVIAFFFNARGEALERSVAGMYRSLLLQLLEQVPCLQCTFRSSSLSPSSINAEYQWEVSSLEAQLEQAVLGLGDTPVVCFIDALDECEQQHVRSMVSFFENLGELAVSSRKSFRVCFSSRHYPEITIKKGLSFELEGQEGHTQDIDDYIASELRIGHTDIAQQVREELQRKASGVFMWVVLVVDILQKEYNRGRMYALKQRLQAIPDDLHQLFYDILTRDSCDEEALILSIQWVLFATQPLTPGQLYLAILSGVEPEIVSQWSPGSIPEADALRRFILDASKGLTEITKSKSQTVQFIHESVRDFLLKDDGLGRIWPHLRENFEGQSQERLKKCCLMIMDLNVEGIPSNLKTVSPQEIAESRTAFSQAFPILEYAVQNIFHHADAAQGAEIDQQNFMGSFPLQKWVKFANLFEKHKIRRYTSSVSMLYILGERNMASLIRSYTFENTCFDVEEERYGCPFFAAIATKSKEAVCAFVDTLNQANGLEKLCTESYVYFYQNKDGRSLLPRDFKYSKNKKMVDYLMDLDNDAALCLAITTSAINLNTILNDTPSLLVWASGSGQRGTVKLLLSNDKVDVNARNGYGQTALIRASQSGRSDIVELLLSNDKVDIDATDRSGQTALMMASQYGRSDIIELLLSNDKVDVDATDRSGQTALMKALPHGRSDIVKLLLSNDKIDINATDRSGQTALMRASQYGLRNIVELLLSTSGVDVNTKGYNAKSALMFAVQVGHTYIVKLLLNTGKVDVNAKDEMDRTPLIAAVDKGNKEVVKLLLSTEKVDVNVKDEVDHTPLGLAVERGYKEIVEMLLRCEKSDVNARNHVGDTPLMSAVRRRNAEIVEMLLRYGKAKTDARDECGSTALMTSARQGCEDIVGLLLRHSQAEINMKDIYGRSALSWAAFGERTPLPNIYEFYPRSAQRLAEEAYFNYEAVVERLLRTDGVDVNSEDGNGCTPLFGAAMNGKVEIVELLLNADNIDLEKRNKAGLTALMLASSSVRQEWDTLILKTRAHRITEDGRS